MDADGYKNIGDYGLIGDRHSAALVGLDGSIDWCTFPRFDSPSVFAAILDVNKGGRFAITPAEVYTGGQHYRPESNVLETHFVTRTGGCVLTDFMPFFRLPDRSFETYGVIVRMLRCEEGAILLRIAYEPRPDYGRGNPIIVERDGGLVVEDGDNEIILHSTLPLQVNESADGAYAEVMLTTGDEATFMVRYAARVTDAPHPPAPLPPPAELLERTDAYWKAQSASVEYDGPWRAEVIRSYLVLHLLVYVPTGAIVAAPTTSLPEWVGGRRNWDYRYTWLRDAAFTVEALMNLGHTAEARGFFLWLEEACRLSSRDGRLNLDDPTHGLHILYRIDGDTEPHEQELPHLEGYKGSGPVRIGNGAYDQLQQDVYGELLASAHLLAVRGEMMPESHWEVVRMLANLAAEEWEAPDNGIWEVRGGPFHFVTSDALCWVALDRAVRLGEMRDPDDPELEKWRIAAEDIRHDVLTDGWSEEKQSFVQHHDTEALDAGLLLLPLMGFLPYDDPRVISTVERIEAELQDGPFVKRYLPEETDDGVFGPEGAFTLCSFWLVQVLARMGRADEAMRIFTELLTYANHLGLFGEMIDPRNGLTLGNFPQAFTHIGLILAALECTWIGTDTSREGEVDLAGV